MNVQKTTVGDHRPRVSGRRRSVRNARSSAGCEGWHYDLQRSRRVRLHLRLLAVGQLHLCSRRVAPQHYVGSINKFGVDIGYVEGAVMAWAVLAPTNNPGPGLLAGTYVGATGSASVGVGVGANGLFGGFGNSISLQPLSVEGSKGFNVAGGIEQMTLSFQPS